MEEVQVDSSDRDLLVVLQVQVGKGISDELTFYDGDNLEEVVQKFAEHHKLTPSKIAKLVTMLKYQVDAALIHRDIHTSLE